MELINYFINKYYNDTFYYHLVSYNNEVAVFRAISNSPLLLNNQ